MSKIRDDRNDVVLPASKIHSGRNDVALPTVRICCDQRDDFLAISEIGRGFRAFLTRLPIFRTLDAACFWPDGLFTRQIGIEFSQFGIREPDEELAKLAVQPPRGVIHRRTGGGIPRGSFGVGWVRGGRVMRQQLLHRDLDPFLRRPSLPRKAQFEDAEFEEL